MRISYIRMIIGWHNHFHLKPNWPSFMHIDTDHWKLLTLWWLLMMMGMMTISIRSTESVMFTIISIIAIVTLIIVLSHFWSLRNVQFSLWFRF